MILFVNLYIKYLGYYIGEHVYIHGFFIFKLQKILKFYLSFLYFIIFHIYFIILSNT